MTLRKSIPVETTCLSIKFIWKSLQDALLITGIQQKVLKIYYQLFHYKGCLQSSWWLPFPRKQPPSSSFSFYILQNTCPAHFTEIGAVKRSIWVPSWLPLSSSLSHPVYHPSPPSGCSLLPIPSHFSWGLLPQPANHSSCPYGLKSFSSSPLPFRIKFQLLMFAHKAFATRLCSGFISRAWHLAAGLQEDSSTGCAVSPWQNAQLCLSVDWTSPHLC